MTNAVAVIGLLFDSHDIQASDFGIFLEIVRGGPHESPSVRGTDTTVPGRTGRIARNRIADRLTIELRGIVTGNGAPATAPETAGGLDTALTADVLAGGTVVELDSAGALIGGEYLRVGDPGETEIRFVADVDGTTITFSAPFLRRHHIGDQVREVDNAGSSGDLADFRTNAQLVHDWFDPTAMPADLVAALEDGSTATIAARTLNTVWDQVAPTAANVSIELESVDPAWIIVPA